MASVLKNLSHYDDSNIPSAEGVHFGIVVSDWNEHITHVLFQGCLDTLEKHGATDKDIHVVQVPGAFELPTGARLLAGSEKLDAIICLGCVIKGDTDHDRYINQSVASGLTQLGLMSGKPVIFGLLTTNSEEQAKERSGGKHGNKGVEAAVTAIRMAALAKSLKKEKKGIGFGS